MSLKVTRKDWFGVEGFYVSSPRVLIERLVLKIQVIIFKFKKKNKIGGVTNELYLYSKKRAISLRSIYETGV